MSYAQKINFSFVSIVGSCAFTSLSLVWIASTKASEIDSAKEKIEESKTELKLIKQEQSETAKSLSKLEERTVLILQQLESLSKRIK